MNFDIDIPSVHLLLLVALGHRVHLDLDGSHVSELLEGLAQHGFVHALVDKLDLKRLLAVLVVARVLALLQLELASAFALLLEAPYLEFLVVVHLPAVERLNALLGFVAIRKAHEGEALAFALSVAFYLDAEQLSELLEELTQVFLVPGVGEVLDVEVVEGGLLALVDLLVLAFDCQVLALLVLVVEEFDRVGHALLLLEAHEAEALRVVLGVERDLGGEDLPRLCEVLLQLLGGHVLGQVLDDDVELGDQLGVLDLPHQAELLAVQLLLVLVVEGLEGLLLVGEVDLAEAQTLPGGEVPADFHGGDLLVALEVVDQFFLSDALVQVGDLKRSAS